MNVFRKYKPEKIEDFDLERYIDNDFLNIVIIGENGTGKTTLLNTIIKTYLKKIHNENYENSANVFRINNLKDCGISFYRTEVKNFCQFPSKKKKLLVVDNLEMVDKSIQSIFKYYMEKWGHNFYFIATTSNTHKINESLLAKTYQLLLPKKTTSQMRTILDNVCENEQIEMMEEAKNYIITHCNGKIKILFMFLQKIYYLNRKIDISLIEENFTMLSQNDFHTYFEACKKCDYETAFKYINKFLNKGYSICDIFDEMFRYIKTDANTNTNTENGFDEETKYEIIKLISRYVLVLNTIHEENIEFYFFTNSLMELLKERENTTL